MDGEHRIADQQNSERVLVLHRAIAVAHHRAMRAHAVGLAVSSGVAALSVLARTVPAAVPTVVLIGASWAGVYAMVVMPWIARRLRTSALLQEMLDVKLFGLPWNRVAAGDPLPEDEVSRLSRHFRGDDSRLRDYYLVANAPPPYDVLFCLVQNLSWGSRVRRRYADLFAALAAGWCAAGIVVGVIGQLTIGDLVSTWYVPSLGLLLLCLDIYRTQVSITRERTRVLALLLATVPSDLTSPPSTSGATWTEFARRIQDALFRMRRQQPRVPAWYFRRWHDADLADFRYMMGALEAKAARPKSDHEKDLTVH